MQPSMHVVFPRLIINYCLVLAWQTIKYGVISTDNLVNDMLSWETLYVSGRLQKPVSTFNYLSRSPHGVLRIYLWCFRMTLFDPGVVTGVFYCGQLGVGKVE